MGAANDTIQNIEDCATDQADDELNKSIKNGDFCGIKWNITFLWILATASFWTIWWGIYVDRLSEEADSGDSSATIQWIAGMIGCVICAIRNYIYYKIQNDLCGCQETDKYVRLKLYIKYKQSFSLFCQIAAIADILSVFIAENGDEVKVTMAIIHVFQFLFLIKDVCTSKKVDCCQFTGTVLFAPCLLCGGCKNVDSNYEYVVQRKKEKEFNQYNLMNDGMHHV